MWTTKEITMEVRVACDEVDVSRRKAYGLRVYLGGTDITTHIASSDLADMEQDLVADVLVQERTND